jgi:exosortase C (VPDSG-CTERM-specific)
MVSAPQSSAGSAAAFWRQLGQALPRGFWVFLGALLLCFAVPLIELARLAFRRDLYSHIVLIPVITLYLLWLRRESLAPAMLEQRGKAATAVKDRVVALAWFGLGAALAAGHLAVRFGRSPVGAEDALALAMLAMLSLLAGGGFWFLGTRWMRATAFPAAFLLFVVPFPQRVENAIELFFQYASADVSEWLFTLAGIPHLRTGRMFALPGIVIEVAQECSGIRSSLVLFITSLLAGNLFLQRGWSRVLLALAVIPLGIVRNAIRILTIAWLCVQVGPHMLYSSLHSHGGPLFFALSLFPFFALLLLLRRWDRGVQGGPRSGPELGESPELQVPGPNRAVKE